MEEPTIIEVYGSRSRAGGWYVAATKTIYMNMDGMLRWANKINGCVIDLYFLVLRHEMTHHVQNIKFNLSYCTSRSKKEKEKRKIMEDEADWVAYKEFIRTFKRKPDVPGWLSRWCKS